MLAPVPPSFSFCHFGSVALLARSPTMCFQRSAFFKFLYDRDRVSKAGNEDIELFLRETFGHQTRTRGTVDKLRETVLLKLYARWKRSNRTKKRFVQKNQAWLAVEECLLEPVCTTP